ncbi:hypothetical protein JR316_0005974 [Psilocybe cubensis]|uniref:Uncharacterized protein n=2 Tax=Psilocybe cubensis TaxID=181762 RepID=A0ACB8H0N7_PSICU|nr:hypothetical protein JR316_0005974 [Psilocybe cubensis]KAH9481448.1 hypothetical protein JR316_0005974 [Psilocybe cubensis]
MPVLVARAEDSDGPTLANPIYLAGLIVAIVILVGAGLWMGLRFFRKRMAAKRQEKTGAAFLSVKGLVRDDPNQEGEKEGFEQRVAKGFLSDINSPTIVFPDKALSPPATRDAVIDYHRRTGSIPKPFAAKPALEMPAFPASTLDAPSSARNSWVSFLGSNRFPSNRSSVLSTASSNISATTGSTRKVRQTFDPVLPDELLISVNEQLTVVQSFDDGWCVVGRENKSLFPTAKSLFKSAPAAEAETTELGVVPAWCFMKPVKGLRAERPVRSTSLGITINLEESGPSRHSILTWSNF